MRNTIISLALFSALIAGAMLLSGCGIEEPADPLVAQPVEKPALVEEKQPEPSIGQPWIQVIKDGVFLVKSAISTASSTKIALKTGDLLKEGDKIETDKTGLANLYFPDGSVARLDSNTRIEIESVIYEPRSKTLVVRVKLAVGNLWSKIIKLATPESLWEVKTSNAVAAVRGTAFGVSYTPDGRTRVIGSENKVTVNLISTSTRALVANQQATVEAKKYIEILPADLGAYIKGTKKLSAQVKAIPPQIYQETWIQSAEQADGKINGQVKEFEVQGSTNDQALEQYRVEVINEFVPLIQAENTPAGTSGGQAPESGIDQTIEPVSAVSETTTDLSGDTNGATGSSATTVELLNQKAPVTGATTPTSQTATATTINTKLISPVKVIATTTAPIKTITQPGTILR